MIKPAAARVARKMEQQTTVEDAVLLHKFHVQQKQVAAEVEIATDQFLMERS